ncbi:MAG: N-acetyltransferase [Phyllobacteriaceae bacterium]|nr:N-acetyltransferase [Phyllobacteriaceae bacterium]
MTQTYSIAPESAEDCPHIDTLHAEAFGPGRYSRAAFRLREQGPHSTEHSFVIRVAGYMRATVRMTPLLIGDIPAWLLGPLAVQPGFAGQGMGKALLRHALDSVGEPVLLVGDPPYYGPFGFENVSPQKVILPGPVDPKRLMVAGLAPEARAALAGIVRHRNRA